MILPSALWVCFVLIILTYISAAAASPSPCAPALSSPSLSPCGQLGRMIRPHSRWKCQKQHEDGRSSAGWLQPEHESLSPWERTNHTALFYWPCAIWTDEVLNVARHNIWYCQCCSSSRRRQSHFMFSKCTFQAHIQTGWDNILLGSNEIVTFIIIFNLYKQTTLASSQAAQLFKR